MPSSTSSSKRLTAADRPGVAQPVPTRDVPDLPWRALLLCALLLAVLLTGTWEWHWRAFGAVPGFRDDDALWARQRRRIDAGDGNATVLIGASRTFFDLQLPVWERLSGRRPIQLALDGTSPLFALEDLANDPAFTGKLLMGVAPDIFSQALSTTRVSRATSARSRPRNVSERFSRCICSNPGSLFTTRISHCLPCCGASRGLSARD